MHFHVVSSSFMLRYCVCRLRRTVHITAPLARTKASRRGPARLMGPSGGGRVQFAIHTYTPYKRLENINNCGIRSTSRPSTEYKYAGKGANYRSVMAADRLVAYTNSDEQEGKNLPFFCEKSLCICLSQSNVAY